MQTALDLARPRRELIDSPETFTGRFRKEPPVSFSTAPNQRNDAVFAPRMYLWQATQFIVSCM